MILDLRFLKELLLISISFFYTQNIVPACNIQIIELNTYKNNAFIIYKSQNFSYANFYITRVL